MGIVVFSYNKNVSVLVKPLDVCTNDQIISPINRSIFKARLKLTVRRK
jgi:PleD family two-component response regulator